MTNQRNQLFQNQPAVAWSALTSWPSALALACAMGMGSCTQTDTANTPFTVKTLPQSVAATAPLAVNDRYVAYAASELGTGPGGTDFNGDSDTSDDVVFVASFGNDQVTPLGVAIKPGSNDRAMAWVNDTLFLVVSEAADGFNWNGDSDTTDTVLLFWHAGLADPVYYATLGSDRMYAQGTALWYEPAIPPSAVGETNIARAVVASLGASPAAPEAITTSFVDTAMDGLSLQIRGTFGDVVWFTASEVTEGQILNGDGDMTDTAILAIYGTGSGGQIQLVPQAMESPSSPVDAFISGSDRIVVYLVNEAAQGVNLNNPALFTSLWQPPQCSGTPDTDTNDNVMHWLNLTTFTADPVINAPINTGLTGSGPTYHLADDWIGIVSMESDEGNCDLNGDTDMNDEILRWVALSANPEPINDASKLVALDTSIAGDSGGVIELDGRLWVALVDEAADGRDHDGSGSNHVILGVLDPALPGTNWNYDQGSNTFIQVTWMQADATTTARFLAAIKESSTGIDRNGDGDTTDSVPTFPREGGAPRELDFPGVNVAVELTNPGMLTRSNYGFYRINETSQGTDYNLDGDLGDSILQRVNLSGSEPATSMGIELNNARPAVLVGAGSNPRGVVWMASEAQQGPAGTDLNGDGDAGDVALRYARLP
ncbi:MAG TPA: hypothetical protein P5218_02055 [Planctomycetota bacterium]|mgnify:CR=1 FL=1|nr:hypothetical protein [Planctomycetota bacterium]